ncbi:tRNA pseudouridine(13) synthase TruD [Streptomyces samsunensis]|uniref:tRNA pseudouridine(13) synthase TruD n=1 Tax=Streptomyces malaysiensis subsp. samsunensis TaxID=459658 RepID=A0A9X2M907_STRMQ|nr:tRNA pseudouridine(13) synthase TruD [Streptomyces samsunensis]
MSTAGLKDEDAVTEQHIACRGRLPRDAITEFNVRHASGERTMTLTTHGYGHLNLHAGQLEGNPSESPCGLSSGFATTLGALGERAENLFFVNYYDVQRFGVAGGPRTTHQIGGALLEEDYGTALALVREFQSPEADHARRFTGPAAQFFDRIDPRVRVLYEARATAGRPVDVLVDRTAETFATWPRGHPEVRVICRDWAGPFQSTSGYATTPTESAASPVRPTTT